MASPPARGLFRRAIAQSPYGIPSHTLEQARQSGVRVAQAMGLPGARATLRQLRALPAEKLAMLQGEGLSLAPSLIVGGAAMPRPLLAAFQAGQQADPDVPAGEVWPVDTLLRPVVMNFAEQQSVERGFMAQRLNTLIGGLRFVGRSGD